MVEKVEMVALGKDPIWVVLALAIIAERVLKKVQMAMLMVVLDLVVLKAMVEDLVDKEEPDSNGLFHIQITLNKQL